MDGVSETLESARSKPRRQWGVTLLWLLPVVFLVAFMVYGMLTRPPVAPDDSTPRVGQLLADFTLPALQGNRVQLSALRGKMDDAGTTGWSIPASSNGACCSALGSQCGTFRISGSGRTSGHPGLRTRACDIIITRSRGRDHATSKR